MPHGLFDFNHNPFVLNVLGLGLVLAWGTAIKFMIEASRPVKAEPIRHDDQP